MQAVISAQIGLLTKKDCPMLKLKGQSLNIRLACTSI